MTKSRHNSRAVAFISALSLLLWVGVIIAGRFHAFTYSHQ